MDDKRFDSLTRALASGTNRRKFLLGLLGIGGAAVVGAELDTPAEAARRPTPTPKPPSCPGRQTPCGSGCCCPGDAPEKCGPDCCTKGTIPVNAPGYSECCDQACCFGTCLPEEGCCATNARPGGLPPTHEICDTVSGRECCVASDVCCLVDGCCPTVCYGGSVGADNCCPESNFCPGGSESPDLCCTGDTPIKCACGTNDNTCIADNDSACCIDSDCDTPPAGYSPCAVGTCVENVCQYTDCNAQTEVCCPDNLGVYACRVGDECCLTSETCADTCEACVNFVCVDDPVTFPCGPRTDPDLYCCPSSNYSLCCGATQFECCGLDAATGITRECDADGKCCEPNTPHFCAGNNTCCSAECVDFGEAEYCCPPGRGRICPGADSFVCCPNGQECSDDGDCCPAGTVACGDECCPVDNICCPVVGPAPLDGECCPSATQCNLAGECCPATFTVCGIDCCDPESETPQCCNGVCVAESVECCSADNPCDGECETCVDGACVDDQDKCFGACGVCVDGTCQGDESLCLSCEVCSFNPDTNTGICVDTCTGCADCRVTDTAPDGACVPDNTECLSCQVCRLDADEAGGTCFDNCPDCGNCVAGDGPGVGICVADDSQCPPGPPARVCCPSNGGFTCEDGPFCGCDGPEDCPPCNRCNAGTCELICTSGQECCPNLGTLGLCVSNVEGVGCCVTGDCTSTGPDECLVGTCSATGVCSYDPDNLLCGPDCGVCSETGECSNNQDACDTCEACVDGTCGPLCSGQQPNCCPDDPDFCVTGAECCVTADCDPGETCIDGFCDCAGEVCADGALCCVGAKPNCCTNVCVTGNECCDAIECTDWPDLCYSATCTDGTCVYTDTCAGECCPDGFCSDAAGECCDDGDCTAYDACTPADCINHACNAASSCIAPFACCGGPTCANTSTDDNNCGVCGNVCSSLLCLDCQGGACVNICPPGTTCNGSGSCVPDCSNLGGYCDASVLCCTGICCLGPDGTGTCTLGDGATCTVNTDCCIAGGDCCREVGQGLQCKPGQGQCICSTDADCALIPNQPTCVGGVCV